MALAAQLNSTTILTPREREQQKTPQQRAEDVIYTLNHAITCLGITDTIIAPVIGALSASVFGKESRVDICGHDHTKDTAATAKAPEKNMLSKLTSPDAEPTQRTRYGKVAASPELVKELLKKERARLPFGKRVLEWISGRSKDVRNWMIGEAAGDVGAVFVTIGIQRFVPSFMNGLHKLMEPVFGGIFRRGADRAAHKWADKHNLAYDSQEVVDRAQELYQYEMRHLPQMAVWTGASVGINYGVMKLLDKELAFSTFAKGKAIGSAVTATLVFGARAFAPDKAHKWDETAGKHVVVPLTKKVGKLFGVKEHDVDAYHEARNSSESPQSWAARVGNEGPASFAARII